MTINETIREALTLVPEITDFFYADPDQVMSNVAVGATPLFRLMRTNDTIGATQYTNNYAQEEYFMLSQVMGDTPEGDDEEAAENRLITLMCKTFAALHKVGLTFEPVSTITWARRTTPSYALGLLFRITIKDTFTFVGDCVTQRYAPDPLPDEQC